MCPFPILTLYRLGCSTSNTESAIAARSSSEDSTSLTTSQQQELLDLMNSEMENERNERKKFTPTADFTQYIIDTKFRPYVCSLCIKDGDKKAFREVKAFVNHFLFDHGIIINEKFRKEKLHGFKCYHPHCHGHAMPSSGI